MRNETERNVAAVGGSFVLCTVYAQRRLAADYYVICDGLPVSAVSTDDRDDVKRSRVDFLVTIDADDDHFPSPATIGTARA